MFGILWAFLLFMGVMMMRLAHHESYCLALFFLFLSLSLTFPYCLFSRWVRKSCLVVVLVVLRYSGFYDRPDFMICDFCTDVQKSHYCFITITKTNDKYVLTDNLEVVHRAAMFGSSMRLFFTKVQTDAEEAVLTFDCIRHSTAPFISVKFLFGVTNKQWLCAKGYRSTIVVGQRSVLVTGFVSYDRQSADSFAAAIIAAIAIVTVHCNCNDCNLVAFHHRQHRSFLSGGGRILFSSVHIKRYYR